MHYQLCPRCKFRVSLNKQLCPTCGYLVTSTRRSYTEDPTPAKKTSNAKTQQAGSGSWWRWFLFGGEPQETKETKRADGPALS